MQYTVDTPHVICIVTGEHGMGFRRKLGSLFDTVATTVRGGSLSHRAETAARSSESKSVQQMKTNQGGVEPASSWVLPWHFTVPVSGLPV
jgi:hypothetical protein